MQLSFDTPVFFLAFLVGLLLAYLTGLRLSRQILGVPSLETVLLVWVGLFLGLTLQQVSQTYRQRIELVHEEADSIAHVYRVLQSLPQSERAQMRLLLIAYLDVKLAQGNIQEVVGLQEQQFKLCDEMMLRHVVSEAHGISLRDAIDHMISMHYRCAYAIDEHLPAPVMALLLIQCLAASLLLGMGGRHAILSVIPIGLMLCAVATGADLDNARLGWVRVDSSNLRDLVKDMHKQEQL